MSTNESNESFVLVHILENNMGHTHNVQIPKTEEIPKPWETIQEEHQPDHNKLS